jgi:hypothetical protein
MSAAPESLLHCSFCEKDQQSVKKLIAGPGVYICNHCINLCNDIIDEEFDTLDDVHAALSSDDGLRALTRLSSKVDLLVDKLRDDGVPWEEIAKALRKDTDED